MKQLTRHLIIFLVTLSVAPMLFAEKYAVIVLGAPRGGTSCTTGVITKLGIPFGKPESLKPADSGNPKGYFENQPIMDFNEKLLQSYGISVSCASRLEISDQDRFSKEVQSIIELLKTEFDVNKNLVLKDVRMPLLIRFYVSALKELGYTLKFVWVKRPAEEAALSAKSFPFTEHDIEMLGQAQINDIKDNADQVNQKICSVYSEEIEDFVRAQHELLEFNFFDLVNSTESTVERLTTFLAEVAFPSEFMSTIKDFIDPRLRHHRLEGT